MEYVIIYIHDGGLQDEYFFFNRKEAFISLTNSDICALELHTSSYLFT